MKVVGIYIQDSETLEYNRVDLFDDEKISVTSSIQNINDISKTYTDYSNTYTVPATKQNNKIFKHWYDNSNDAPFSTLVKSLAYIEIDTIPFRKGKIQLESANVVDGKPQDYSITFIGILGNLKDTFAGKYLKKLTSNVYDFVYTPANVANDIFVTAVSSDVMFPLITSTNVWEYGSNYNIGNSNGTYPIRYNDLFPAIRISSIFNMIQTEFGINFEGTFLNDNKFLNAYLWLKNAETFKTKQDIRKSNFNSISGTTPYSDTGYFINLTNDTLTNATAPASITNLGDFEHKEFTFSIVPFVAYVSFSFYVYKNGILFYDSGVKTSGDFVTQSYLVETTTDRFATNDVFEFYVGSTGVFSCQTRVSQTGWYRKTINGVVYNSSRTVTMTGAMNIGSVFTLQIKDYMPEIKIEDFFTGILKMFNLTCYSTDGINYTIEQLENYYGAGIDIDITKYIIQDKKALNRVKTYKIINFEYEKSQSFVNQAFNSNAGIEYGSLRYENIPKTEGDEYSIKLPFEDLNFSNLSGLLQVGYCLKTDYKAYVPKPIILYDYNPTSLTSIPTIYFSETTNGQGSPYNTYKAFGQETLISGETYGLNFNQQQSTLTNEVVNNSLYQQYYSEYFANIYNLKARLIKVSAILPTSILTTLKLNDSIIMRDAKYLINTYTTDLTTGEVQFELLTDQRE